jgi:drug/metabolite transporter (DMT)-like permease
MFFALTISFGLSRVFARGTPALLPWPVYRRNLWAFVIEGFGGSLFYLYGLSHSRLAVGAVLTSLAPVVSVPVAVAFGLERFSLARTAGVTMVVLGIILLFV